MPVGPSTEELARRAADEATRVAMEQALAQQHQAMQQVLDQNRLTMEQALAQNREIAQQERRLASGDLDAKKSLIDQQLETMNLELHKVEELMRSLEAERSTKLGQLSGVLEQQRAQIHDLSQTTQSLREALSSTKVRGQWGERMAEDVLRLAGFVEGVNYRKQHAIATGIPDFTFLLPDDLCLHMDVKFPLDNYLRYLEAEGDIEQRRTRDDVPA